jgi:hypothetical protein
MGDFPVTFPILLFEQVEINQITDVLNALILDINAALVTGAGTVTNISTGTGLTGGPISTSGMISLVTPVSVANGGTGTSTPSLIAGASIAVTGSWPNQTVAFSGSGGLIGGTNIAVSGVFPNQTVSFTPPGGITADVGITITGSWPNQIVKANFDAPPAIGSATPGFGTFTGISLVPTSPGVILNCNSAITQAAFGTPDWFFANTDSIPSFSSASTHFGFVIQSSKGGTGVTGSRQAFTAQQLGLGGGTADFFTAGFFLAKPTAGSNNNGNFTGSNPYVYIPVGMTPQTAVGEEIDVTTFASPSAREGLRIADIGSTAVGTGLDTAIAVIGTGIGFKHMLFIGDNAGLNFPIPAGGDIINTISSSVALNAGIDLSHLTGAYTIAPIVLAANNKGVWWGSAKAGGSVVSETTTGGGDIVLGNAFVAFRFAGVANTFIYPNYFYTAPISIATLLALTGVPTAVIATINNGTAYATGTYGSVVSATGTTIRLVIYNGANWIYN